MATEVKALHTPELLRVEENPQQEVFELVSEGGFPVAVIEVIDPDIDPEHRNPKFTPYIGQDKGNAYRLAACWNACKDIPTEVLEVGALSRFIDQVRVLINVISDPRVENVPLEVLREGTAFHWLKEALSKLEGSN